MAQEIDLGGTIYISSKRAAEITGYTQDYVGQLARGGMIEAQRISGLWYVLQDSLQKYKEAADEFKPEPPKPLEPKAELDTSVSFDGRDYVSTKRAAEITSYHEDYVGQLARTGKILSRQIGTRWYVDRQELVEHKKHNDALLAAVQAESVGIQRDEPRTLEMQPEMTHFNYVQETNSALPEIENKVTYPIFEKVIEEPQPVEVINDIPIRVVRPGAAMPSTPTETRRHPAAYERKPQTVLAVAIFGIVVLAGAAGIYYTGRGQIGSIAQNVPRNIALTSSASSNETVTNISESSAVEFLRRLVSKEITYNRQPSL